MSRSSISPTPGKLVIISAPSGGGKTSLVQAVLKRVPGLALSVSHTTRAARADEVDGIAYHFVATETFERMIEKNEFLEHARVFDHDYGTSRAAVEKELQDGRDVILEIDWQGARQVRAAMPDVTGVFILPPSLATLEQRLTERGDDRESITRRMRDAVAEIRHCREYDVLLVNDRFHEAVDRLTAIIAAIRRRQPPATENLDGFVDRLLNGSGNFE